MHHGLKGYLPAPAAKLTKLREAERGRQCIYRDVVFIYSPAVSSVLSFLRILSSPVPFNCNLLMDSFTLPVKTVITALS